jgi:hypothetical protein
MFKTAKWITNVGTSMQDFNVENEIIKNMGNY